MIDRALIVNKYLKLIISLCMIYAVCFYFYNESSRYDKIASYIMLCYFGVIFLETYLCTRNYKTTKTKRKAKQFIFTDLIFVLMVLLGFISYIFFNDSSLVNLWIISLLGMGIKAAIFSLETGIPIEFTRRGVWIKKNDQSKFFILGNLGPRCSSTRVRSRFLGGSGGSFSHPSRSAERNSSVISFFIIFIFSLLILKKC